jgi:tRNA(Ile)-lysidine synthase
MLSGHPRRGSVFFVGRSLTYVEDSSNADEKYSRNLIRRRVIPVLKRINPRMAEHAASTAELLREDEAYLSGLAVDFIQRSVRSDARAAVVARSARAWRCPRPVAAGPYGSWPAKACRLNIRTPCWI